MSSNRAQLDIVASGDSVSVTDFTFASAPSVAAYSVEYAALESTSFVPSSQPMLAAYSTDMSALTTDFSFSG